MISVCARLSVCLFVCLSVFISRNHTSKFRKNFCTCYLWPRLGYTLTTMQCVMYLPVLWMISRFHIMRPTGQNHRRRACFVEIARWQHQRRSCFIRLQTCVCLFICSLFIGAQYWCLSWRTTERMLQRSSVYHGFFATNPFWIELRQCISFLSLFHQIIPQLHQQT